jgi:predicted glutamine amidotransferase
MYRRGKTIHIVKGFFDVDALWKSLQAVKEADVCIHFRWATHGAVNRGNCHPFPVTDNVKEMQNTRAHCKVAVAHNGIIHGMKASKYISDTMMFIKTMDKSKKLESQVLKDDGKFCVFTERQSYLVGEFLYNEGIFYSNEDYKAVHRYIPDSMEDDMLKMCNECTSKTCEGCPFLEEYEKLNDAEIEFLKGDKAFKDDYRDMDDEINEMC